MNSHAEVINDEILYTKNIFNLGHSNTHQAIRELKECVDKIKAIKNMNFDEIRLQFGEITPDDFNLIKRIVL